jgi:DNA-directed RNA polymerase specialized sigma24 family protein
MSRNFASDQVLIDSLRLNNTEAFEELFRRYWYNLYIYSLKKLHSSDDARQIVRDIFKELWEKRQSWPVDFSLQQHLYAEVRKGVVKCLDQALASESDNAIINQEILPGFSVLSLQQAKVPVTNNPAAETPDRSASSHMLRRRNHGALAQVKSLFNIVASRLN